MTDPAVAPIPAEIAASLSPETKATFIQQMQAAGHSKEAVEAALASPSQRAPVNPNGMSYRTAAEADAAADASRKSAEDRVRANVLQHTAPPDGGSYDLDWSSHQGLDLADQVDANSQLTSAFAQAGLPAQLGRPLHAAMSDSVDAVIANEGNEAGLRSWRQSQEAIVSRLPGGREEVMRYAAIFTARLPSTVFKDLTSAGAFDSAGAIIMASHAGRAIEARELSQKK